MHPRISRAFCQLETWSTRMCVDNRNSDVVTVNDKYMLPQIDDLLERLRRAKHFSKID